MNRLLESLAELNALEASMHQTSAALVETTLRLRSLKQRGPLITLDLQDWICDVQDLEQELKSCLERLSGFLNRIHWDGPEIPQRNEQWVAWWNTVRRRLIREALGVRRVARNRKKSRSPFRFY